MNRRHRLLLSAALVVAAGVAATDIGVLAATGGPSSGTGTAQFAYRSGSRIVHGERKGVPAGDDGFALTHTYTFTGGSVDQSKADGWAVYDSHYSGDPNSRVPGLVTVSDGALHVRTNGAQGSGLCLCRGTAKPSSPYGRWDIRARASRNADHGFAVLLWPNAENWPVGGEIDLAEFPGPDRNKLQSTVHYGRANRQAVTFTSGDFTRWHTYSVVWTSSSVTFLLDGTQIAEVSTPGSIPTGAMHLALQAGVNTGVTTPSDTSASLDVAWVKTYR